MPLDIPAIQRALREGELDGWLLYDFHGSNPIATRLSGVDRGGHLTTRRWYYLIPRDGEPRALVHAIERHNLDPLPGRKIIYGRRDQLEAGLTQLLQGVTRVAMEYSPGCAIPYVSRVDAGTAEAIRSRGVEIVSSGDLVQAFEAVWTPEQLETHRIASRALYRIKDKAFNAAAAAVRAGTPLTEYQLQQQMVTWFADEGLVSDSAPVVAVGPHAGDPHYLPTEASASVIGPDQLLLLDLWGKQTQPDAVFADITWVGFTGRVVPAPMAKVFDAAAAAVRAGTPLTEYQLQQQMVAWFADEGLVSDSAPVVAVGPHAGNPHYLPTEASASVIGPDQLLLLDLWGKQTQPGAVFADITWVGYTGRVVPAPMAKVFDAAARARDVAVTLVQAAAREGRELRGWEVDRAARTVLVEAGFEAQVLHRTGHSLGESVHGNGAHLDDFETHDDRRLLPGTGFTVEPGVYLEDFGVRTEINVFRGDREAVVTGPCQDAIVALLS